MGPPINPRVPLRYARCLAAHAAQIPVIHVVVGFRAGQPEAGARNKMLRDMGIGGGGIGCFDPDPEVHRVLTEKVFPVQADVVTVDDWIKSST